jgi:hypothetical protein
MCKTLKVIMVAAVFATALRAFPRQVTIPLMLGQSANCPITLSGTVLYVDDKPEPLPYSFRVTINATNVSSNEILAVIVNTKITGNFKIELQSTRKEDYFFHDKLIGVKTSVQFEDDAGPFGSPRPKIDQLPKPSEAIATVVFVQFADGSTWGDAAAGREMLLDRARELSELKQLAEVYDAKGNAEFVTALENRSSGNAIKYLHEQVVKNRNNATIVFKTLSSMIASADHHQVAMGSGPAVSHRD